jgi:hypothetical protein
MHIDAQGFLHISLQPSGAVISGFETGDAGEPLPAIHATYHRQKHGRAIWRMLHCEITGRDSAGQWWPLELDRRLPRKITPSIVSKWLDDAGFVSIP